MPSERVSGLIHQVIGAMRPGAPNADPALQARIAIVIRHVLEAVEEARLTEAELTAVCAFLDKVAQTKEALIGFRGGEARTGKLGCGHLVRERRRE
jgi:hypothetical protein